VTLLAGILIGLVAVVAAMRVRRGLSARLGQEWRRRFLLVQGLPINVVLFLVLGYVVSNLDLGNAASWVLLGLYGPLFFGYSIANIDWTARKFHGEET
jgi:hypothetical protein